MEFHKTISFPVYGYKVRLIVTDNIPALAKRFHAPNPHAVAFCANTLDRPLSWLVLPLKTSAATMGHEAYHCTMNMLRWVGVEEFDDEIVAHHLDHIINEVMKFYFSPKLSAARAALDKRKEEEYNGNNRSTGPQVESNQKPIVSGSGTGEEGRHYTYLHCPVAPLGSGSRHD